jgi:hypothetical protein
MQTPTEGSILREKLATVERKGAGKPFSDDLRRAVVDYGAKRCPCRTNSSIPPLSERSRCR